MTTVGDMKKHVASLVGALQELLSRLQYVERERDEFRAQLAEATDALTEIRDSLRNNLSMMEGAR